MKKVVLFIFASFSLFGLLGCQQMKTFSPDQVVANVLEENTATTYYGELHATMSILDETDEYTLKEWRKGDKVRIEVSSDVEELQLIVNEENVFLNNKINNEVLIFESFAQESLNMDPREHVELLLRETENSHDIEIVGEETVVGRETLYVTLTQKAGKKTLLGNQELWIDKENWIVLKMKSNQSDFYYTAEYTHIDFQSKVDDSIFEFDIPNDANVQQLEGAIDEGTEITIEEIQDHFTEKVYYIPDSKAHTIEKVVLTKVDGALVHKDVTIEYKQNGLPLMSLMILEEDKEDLEKDLAILKEVSKPVTIRGTAGCFIDGETFRTLNWTENDLSYSIELIDPNLSVETVLEWSEQMEQIND